MTRIPKERGDECREGVQGCEEYTENVHDNKDTGHELIFYAQSLYRQELQHDSLFKTFQPHFDVGLDEFIDLKMFSSSLFLSREFIEGSDVFVTLLVQPQP